MMVSRLSQPPMSQMLRGKGILLKAVEVFGKDGLAMKFQDHLHRIESEIYQHEVIQRNPYTKWFKLGHASTPQIADLVTQFSVFSNYFIPLEAKRMVNSATEEEEKEARAILGSEIGVSIDPKTGDIEYLQNPRNHSARTVSAFFTGD